MCLGGIHEAWRATVSFPRWGSGHKIKKLAQFWILAGYFPPLSSPPLAMLMMTVWLYNVASSDKSSGLFRGLCLPPSPSWKWKKNLIMFEHFANAAPLTFLNVPLYKAHSTFAFSRGGRQVPIRQYLWAPMLFSNSLRLFGILHVFWQQNAIIGRVQSGVALCYYGIFLYRNFCSCRLYNLCKFI